MHAKKVTILVVGMSLCAAAQAEQATVGALGAIQSSTILLQAKVRQAKAEEELRSLTGRGSPEFSTDSKPDEIGSSDVPYASGAGGAYGKFTATFVYGNGSQIEAGVGQIIPGGFKVASITLDQAIITHGKRTYQIPYGVKPSTPKAAVTSESPNSPPAMSLPGQAGAPMPRPAVIN